MLSDQQAESSAELRRLVAKLVPIRMQPATGMARRFLGATGHQNQALEKMAAPAPWESAVVDVKPELRWTQRMETKAFV